MTTNKKNKQNKKKLTITCLIIGVICYIVYVSYDQQVTLNRLKQEQLYYAKQLEKSYQLTQQLKRTKETCKSDEYIEKVSREQLGMVKPDEKVYIDATK